MEKGKCLCLCGWPVCGVRGVTQRLSGRCRVCPVNEKSARSVSLRINE